ncbi:Hypothetical protein MVR_LOCUS155 [uncultured virus]|nr:Hypothetical protein MVR_LOCUS155 [uncultured virus]
MNIENAQVASVALLFMIDDHFISSKIRAVGFACRFAFAELALFPQHEQDDCYEQDEKDETTQDEPLVLFKEGLILACAVIRSVIHISRLGSFGCFGFIGDT